MKAPKTIRAIVAEDTGEILGTYNEAIGLNHVRKRRRALGKLRPDTKLGIATYVLKTNEIREVIRLAGNRKKKP